MDYKRKRSLIIKCSIAALLYTVGYLLIAMRYMPPVCIIWVFFFPYLALDPQGSFVKGIPAFWKKTHINETDKQLNTIFKSIIFTFIAYLLVIAYLYTHTVTNKEFILTISQWYFLLPLWSVNIAYLFYKYLQIITKKEIWKQQNVLRLKFIIASIVLTAVMLVIYFEGRSIFPVFYLIGPILMFLSPNNNSKSKKGILQQPNTTANSSKETIFVFAIIGIVLLMATLDLISIQYPQKTIRNPTFMLILWGVLIASFPIIIYNIDKKSKENTKRLQQKPLEEDDFEKDSENPLPPILPKNSKLFEIHR